MPSTHGPLGTLPLAPVALYLALAVAPADYQQGEAYRIMFIHVPAAWMSMFAISAWRWALRRG